MNEAKTRKLEKAGWRLGTPKEFLGLTDEKAALIEIKLALARGIKERRLSLRLTQEDLATQLKSSQSRIAKMEASDATVSMDFLVRSLLVLGGWLAVRYRATGPSRDVALYRWGCMSCHSVAAS